MKYWISSIDFPLTPTYKVIFGLDKQLRWRMDGLSGSIISKLISTLPMKRVYFKGELKGKQDFWKLIWPLNQYEANQPSHVWSPNPSEDTELWKRMDGENDLNILFLGRAN